jgi:branched-chain amino acid transport system substrate-binding protein
MKLIKTILTCAVFLLASSIVFAGGEGDTIKIGVAGPHTGDLASYGIPTIRAAELVVKEINDNGGIDGKLIELIIEDEECDLEKAANVAFKLAGDGVVAVIGHICSGATKSALGIYEDEGIIAISPSATNPDLTQSGEYANFFRTIAPDDAQARLQVDFLTDTLGVKSVAILHDKGDYGKGLAEFAQTFFEAEGEVEVVLFDGITAGSLDYSSILNRIAETGAEAILFGGYHPEASKLVQQLRASGSDTIFISGDGIKDDSFIQVAGEVSEGVYATSGIDTSSNPIAVKAIEAHRAMYGEDPGPFFLQGYAAALALLNAIEVSGSTDAADIRAALQANSVATSVGNIRFDAKGDAVGVGFAVYQVDGGKFVSVE